MTITRIINTAIASGELTESDFDRIWSYLEIQGGDCYAETRWLVLRDELESIGVDILV